jgi:hypothetical protein
MLIPWPGNELISTQMPDTFTQTDPSPTAQLSHSGGGPYNRQLTLSELSQPSDLH